MWGLGTCMIVLTVSIGISVIRNAAAEADAKIVLIIAGCIRATRV